jgi:hypothetical protein
MLVVASCDPLFDFRGRIANSDDKPIADAKARVTCDGNLQFSAVSDQEGRFSSHGIGWRPNTCSIEIDAPGRHTLRLSVKDHCSNPHGGDACLGVWVDVVVP